MQLLCNYSKQFCEKASYRIHEEYAKMWLAGTTADEASVGVRMHIRFYRLEMVVTGESLTDQRLDAHECLKTLPPLYFSCGLLVRCPKVLYYVTQIIVYKVPTHCRNEDILPLVL